MPRRLSNPLALAVLACLYERPMHPYEIATTLRARAKHESIKLNYGSLYTVVESLRRHRLIVPAETTREGRRPERTVYALTPAGRLELRDWLAELLSTPVKEYTQFEAGLSLMPGLSPDEVVALLAERRLRLEMEIRGMRATHELAAEQGIPRLFTVESEYRLVLREAELEWVGRLAREIDNGTLEGVDRWRALHAAREVDDGGEARTPEAT